MNTLLIGDNAEMLDFAVSLVSRRNQDDVTVACSAVTTPACDAVAKRHNLPRIDIREVAASPNTSWGVIISLHCRQIFPAELVERLPCYNFHPGYNPYNRGWFPHVFSILNGLPAGVTIHKMDNRIDHGAIVHQERLEIGAHETSGQVYARILAREKELLDAWLDPLISGQVTLTECDSPGNLNLRADFEALKELDLDAPTTAREVLNRLRALTFEGYRNAWFRDETTGEIVFVDIRMKRESDV